MNNCSYLAQPSLNFDFFCATLFRVMSFTSVIVLISNSSLTETRGTVNGYGQALCAIGRSLGPVVGAPLLAWSENTGNLISSAPSTQFTSYHDNNDELFFVR